MLGLPPDADLRVSFYAAVRQQQRRFGPRELATVLWAYGAMGTDVQEDAVQVGAGVSVGVGVVMGGVTGIRWDSWRACFTGGRIPLQR